MIGSGSKLNVGGGDNVDDDLNVGDVGVEENDDNNVLL